MKRTAYRAMHVELALEVVAHAVRAGKVVDCVTIEAELGQLCSGLARYVGKQAEEANLLRGHRWRAEFCTWTEPYVDAHFPANALDRVVEEVIDRLVVLITLRHERLQCRNVSQVRNLARQYALTLNWLKLMHASTWST